MIAKEVEAALDPADERSTLCLACPKPTLTRHLIGLPCPLDPTGSEAMKSAKLLLHAVTATLATTIAVRRGVRLTGST